jgi:hypothetical protein
VATSGRSFSLCGRTENQAALAGISILSSDSNADRRLGERREYNGREELARALRNSNMHALDLATNFSFVVLLRQGSTYLDRGSH